ncbi:MAG: hypothetical protein ACJ8AI_27945 [Rhodopila sp.]
MRVATYLGLIVGIGATVFLLQLLIRTLLFGNPVPGYPSLMAVVLFMGGRPARYARHHRRVSWPRLQ